MLPKRKTVPPTDRLRGYLKGFAGGDAMGFQTPANQDSRIIRGDDSPVKLSDPIAGPCAAGLRLLPTRDHGCSPVSTSICEVICQTPGSLRSLWWHPHLPPCIKI